MKSPEEIKKGLAACKRDGDCDRGNCPYHSLGTGTKCIPALTADALAYIQQLEMLAKPNEQIRWERDIAIDQLRQLGIGFGEKVEAQVPKWISVEERLPEKEERVLFFAKEPRVTMDTAFGWWVNTTNRYKITHWMPLLEPPKEG